MAHKSMITDDKGDATYAARFSKSDYPYYSFGIIGDFPGDKELGEEIEWCRQTFASASTGKPPLARLVSLLDTLPWRGRHAVVREIIAPSPHRDAILRDLYDYCFQCISNDEDDEDMDTSGDGSPLDMNDVDNDFVMIANPDASETPKPLNLLKHHIFQEVIVLMALSGAAGGEMCRRYFQSASTRYRGRILVQCVTTISPDHFSDEELWQSYEASPDDVQCKVVEACKQSGRRQMLLQRIYEHKLSTTGRPEPDFIYWLSSDYVASNLPEMFKRGSKLERWGVHGNVYLDYLRGRLEECGVDMLKRGDVWSSFINRCVVKSISKQQILDLWEMNNKYCPCRTNVHDEKSAYLRELSKISDVSSFDTKWVSRIYLYKTFLDKLPQKERTKLMWETVKNRDWHAFTILDGPYSYNFCGAKQSPLSVILTESNPDNVWNSILGINFQDQFLRHVMKEVSEGKTEEHPGLLQAWVKLHLEKLSDRPKNRGEWKRWFTSYRSAFVKWSSSSSRGSHGPNLIVKGRTNRLLQHLEMPFPVVDWLAGQVKNFKELTNILLDGIHAATPHLDAEDFLDDLSGVLPPWTSYEKLVSRDQTKELAKHLEGVISAEMLPRLENMLQFDPHYQARFINAERLNLFSKHVTGIIQYWSGSRVVSEGLAAVLVNVYAKAQAPAEAFRANKLSKFTTSLDASSARRQLITLDTACPQRAIKECLVHMTDHLREMKSQGVEFDCAKSLWSCKESIPNLDCLVYLRDCSSCLTARRLQEEKETILARSKKYIETKNKEQHYRLAGVIAPICSALVNLNLLEAVLDICDIPGKTKDALIRDYGAFSNEDVQKSLKEDTYAADGEKRAAAMTKWLDKATTSGSLDLISMALKFVVTRLKNESGVHRRTILTWIGDKIASRVIALSFGSDDSSSMVTCAEIATSLSELQDNDFGRRDSVGRMVCFPELPAKILEEVYSYYGMDQQLEKRRLWIDSAIGMNWKFEQAIRGRESLRCYLWPRRVRRGPIAAATWVTAEAVKDGYPLSEKGNKQRLLSLFSSSFTSNIPSGFTKDGCFGPEAAITCLCDSLERHWVQEFENDSSPFLFNESFAADEDKLRAWQKRILYLMQLCGRQWQEVDKLAMAVDSVFSGLEGASEQWFENASFLLGNLISTHGSHALQIPWIAKACDSVFRDAVKRGRQSDVASWFTHWQRLYEESGSPNWDAIKDRRLRLELMYQTSSKDVLPFATQQKLTKTDKSLRRSLMCREALVMSANSLVVPVIRKFLLSNREDIFYHISSKSGAELAKGPFSSFGEFDSAPSFVFKTTEAKSLQSCTAEICVIYTHQALAEAKNDENDLRKKMDAMSKFIEAPATQHSDVLAALQTDLEESVREVLINGVFSLDAPWHVLGFLLSQKTIEKNDQRITSALLGHVAKHVHVSKVVQVLRVLLKYPRRNKLTLQLHKAVIRMLFDAKTNESEAILRKEWGEKLPPGVQSLIINKCMSLVAGGKTDGWEIEVLKQVATDQTLDIETKFLLLAPIYGRLTEFSVQKADSCEPDEVFEQYRTKQPSAVLVTSVKVADAFYGIMRLLEGSSDGSLHVLARCRRLSLARVYDNEIPDDSQQVMDEMRNFLTTPLEASHSAQVSSSWISYLFATGVANLVSKRANSPHGVGAHQGLYCFREKTRDVVRAICDAEPSVQALKSCFKTNLELLLDTPLRQSQKRQQAEIVLKCLLTTLENEDSSGKLVEVTVSEPFKNELRLISAGVHSLSSIARVYRVQPRTTNGYSPLFGSTEEYGDY